MAIPRGYVRIRKSQLGWGFRDEIKKSLTIVAESTSSFKKEPTIISCWDEDAEFVGVPRGYYNCNLKRRGIVGEFNYSLGATELPPTEPIKLRTGQEPVISAVVKSVLENGFGGAVASMTTGAGKTPTGLEASRRLGSKTLVIVHTSVLMNQWKTEIPKFFPNWKIGTLQADKIDVEGKDIVVGMLQTLYQKEYDQSLFDEFGTIIIDEVHVTSAEEFSRVLSRFTARAIIGLSGTVQRKDKAESVFIYSTGPIIKGPDVPVLDPEIYFIDTQFAWSTSIQKIDMARTKLITKLPDAVERNEIIIRQACKAAEAGRSVLVLTERVAHAKNLGYEIANRLKPKGLTVGTVVGETKQSERDLAYKANVLVATVQLIATGFNEPRLDTLIFATPVQSFEQAVGRIRRLHEGKKKPFVLDLVDTRSSTAMVLARARFKKYLDKGWKLNGVNVFGKEFLWKYRTQLQKMSK